VDLLLLLLPCDRPQNANNKSNAPSRLSLFSHDRPTRSLAHSLDRQTDDLMVYLYYDAAAAVVVVVVRLLIARL